MDGDGARLHLVAVDGRWAGRAPAVGGGYEPLVDAYRRVLVAVDLARRRALTVTAVHALELGPAAALAARGAGDEGGADGASRLARLAGHQAHLMTNAALDRTGAAREVTRFTIVEVDVDACLVVGERHHVSERAARTGE